MMVISHVVSRSITIPFGLSSDLGVVISHGSWTHDRVETDSATIPRGVRSNASTPCSAMNWTSLSNTGTSQNKCTCDIPRVMLLTEFASVSGSSTINLSAISGLGRRPGIKIEPRSHTLFLRNTPRHQKQDLAAIRMMHA